MPERRIAEIVGEACSGNNVADMVYLVCPRFLRIAEAQRSGNLISHRLPYACHFQRMRQPVVHEYAAWQGEYLGLVL